jgi:hypothetical protein
MIEDDVTLFGFRITPWEACSHKIIVLREVINQWNKE